VRVEKAPAVGKEMDVIIRALEAETIDESELEGDPAEDVADSDSAVVRLVNQIIIDAYRLGASDIHIEPNGHDQNTLVRFRVDGQCSLYQAIPPAFRSPLVARIKIMAHLDISEKRRPQDGKIRFRMSGGLVELRVATIPTVGGGEDVVMRILAASKPLPIDEMGLSERNLAELQKIIHRPYGLVLCVGPTGSGKTTTLHSALGAINTVGRKIWTAEDPVEITQAGLRQVQVKPKIGFTFAAAMRSFLRADPDVIMIGEMRDEETAGTAIEASLTGHLVLSTLHTNSAPETVTRLLDMGLDPFTFSDALLGVMAQRLARGLCKRCREPVEATEIEYQEIVQGYGETAMRRRLGVTKPEELELWRAKGCEACNNTGYKGRLALHELLIATDPIKAAIQRKATVAEIRAVALEEGMTTLLQDGIEKSIAGKTDLKQVLAVCSR
jgi:type II secretory ATPase GspE/PulE/Tfp pilus assembly ATPase PilB-like protein